MKYLIYLVSLLLVLSFVGCGKAKDTTAKDATETMEQVVDDATEVVDDAPEAVEEAVEEVIE